MATQVLMAYMGRRESTTPGTGRKIFHVWKRLDPAKVPAATNQSGLSLLSPEEIQEASTTRWYGPKNVSRHANVGQVFRFWEEEAAGGKTTVTVSGEAGPCFVGRWPVELDRVQWSTEDATMQVNREAERAPAAHLEALEPLARVYRTASSLQRAVILAQVVKYLDSAAFRARVKNGGATE